ncbi:helix-turn-helix domain-containing protein [Burkholderia gladioli]|uniref:helix-turn-helix domain-containing protein n=1 Tax=Burkholderia gladioli TaxID=28095 RepID=UPI0016414276|nr:XRE family transcriptional regulator [Burkholderia gladioli]
MTVHDRIAERLRVLRDARGWSLETLAEHSGVSRSNISLIERGQSSPTAVVLDKLATALAVPLSSLFGESGESEAPSPIARAADQPLWTNPASGYQRRQLSPALRSPIQLVEVHFPPGARVHFDTSARDADIHQQIWLLEGVMEITAGTTAWRLEAGDCVAMRLDSPMQFHNPTRRPARYLVALSTR